MTWGAGNRTYGGSDGADEEARALEACLAAGIDFFDTAELYGRGSSERRLGEPSRGREIVVAALRWLLEQEGVLPIPGAKNPRQASENAGALSFSMTREELETISEAARAWRA